MQIIMLYYRYSEEKVDRILITLVWSVLHERSFLESLIHTYEIKEESL